ncbi:IS630 family transposase [Desulfobulbus oligotrophicus]|uniref:IS630 family transposase n=1 Tax=Desulfobulbus oligotrophicus TaxID=1909699 RepID=A0A7T5VDU2_9BACT|nr:IS630 family transposase [Desulfobulbus oligotrophicus]
MARRHEKFTITDEQRQDLEALLRSPKTAQDLASRAKIILLTASGKTAEDLIVELGTTFRTIYRWRKRFKEYGIHGLVDRPRSGQPKKLTDATVKEVLRMTVECIPHEATHWSVRLMAKAAKVTTWQVRQIWNAADLKPHRLKNFKISNDPNFAEKVIDIVGLYMNPPENAAVFSVDEKTQIQALDRTQPMLPMRPGQIERRTHDYKRNGTTNLYAAFDILTGQVLGRTTKRHRAKEFLDFLRQLNRAVPAEVALHVILDNSSTHKTADVMQWLKAHPRFTFHFTPTSTSWLNAVESWFGQLERRAIHRGVFTSVKDLRDEIHRFIKQHNNRSAKPFTWTKTAAVILEKVSKLKDDTNRTGH